MIIPIFENYSRIITDANHVWQEGEIIYFRTLLNTASALKELFCNADHEFKITQAQQNEATHHIRSNSFKKNGDLRENNILGQREIDIIRHPKVSHVIIGLYDASAIYKRSCYVPLYRAYTPDGDSFKYPGVDYSNMSTVG